MDKKLKRICLHSAVLQKPLQVTLPAKMKLCNGCNLKPNALSLCDDSEEKKKIILKHTYLLFF